MRRFIVAALFTLASAGTATAQARNDSTAIRRLDSLWSHMYAVKDTATAKQLYHDGLLFTSANGDLKIKERELDDVRPSAGTVVHYFRSAPRRIQLHGNTAIVSGRAEWSFSSGGGAARDVQRTYTMVYVRGGPLGWRIVSVHMGTAPPR